MTKLRVKPLYLSSFTFNLVISIALVALYNQPLWRLLIGDNDIHSIKSLFFIVSFAVFLVATFTFVLTCFSVKFIQKPLAITLFISAFFAVFFMNSYGIVFDKTMIQNTLETDTKEVLDIFSMNMLMYFVLFGLLPSALVMWCKIEYNSFFKELKKGSIITFGCVLMIAINLAVFYKDYSSTFRNNREIRNVIVPSSYIYYSVRYLSGAYEQRDADFEILDSNASIKPQWQKLQEKSNKKVVTIVIVGETARSMNFSLNGYRRKTNPKLAQQSIINFRDASSCGTATAVSVPCMFSYQTKNNFNNWQAKNSENVLDIFKKVGFDVMWRENNSGCKGVCDRVETQAQAAFKTEEFCSGQRCFDEVLLSNLDQYLARNNKNTVIVLHQNGSHGPAYYKRYPQAFEKFTPVCESSDLSSCSQQSIINSYDNTILYTDHFINKTIEFLAQRSDKYTTAMLYVSDHGESLGENNIYLHGLPYSMAPEVQYKIPFMAWFSQEFKKTFKIDGGCLADTQNNSISHDNLFHSLLGLMGVKSKLYDSKLDVFATCTKQNDTGA